MGFFDKLRSNFGVKMPAKELPGNDASIKSSGGYRAGAQQPLTNTNQLATYLVPGSAAVQVSGSSMATPVANLKTGQKILGVDVGTGNALIWATLQHIEEVPQTASLVNKVEVGLGGDDTALLRGEQVVLTRDRKKRHVMQEVRRFEIGVSSVVAFNAEGLQWRGKKAQECKKISSLRVVRENATENLYKLTVGSTDHSVLMSCTQDSKYFFIVNSSNSTVSVKAVNEKAAEISSIPKMEIKNTFINVEVEEEKEARDQTLRGIPRSYSDTDIHKLAVELEMEQPHTAPTSMFASDDMLDLSSNHSSTLTSRSRVSSILAKSEVSSKSGGSIGHVRVGKQSVINEDGNQTSNSDNLISLSEYSQLPVNEYGVRLSEASIMHKPGRRSTCRKCAFYNTFSFKKGKVCKNGALCDFCHETHDRFIHRR